MKKFCQKAMTLLLALTLLLGLLPTLAMGSEVPEGEVPPVITDTIETTLTDGMSQNGSRRTFDVIARDKDDAKISATCKLNDEEVYSNWDDSVKTSFTLDFTEEGENKVEIKAGTATAVYTIHYTKAQPGDVIGQATVAVEAFTIGGGYIVAPCSVDILEGENAAQLLDGLLTEKGFTYDSTGSPASGFYLSCIIGTALNALPTDASKAPQALLSAIGDDFGAPAKWERSDVNSLGEFDFTFSSGWMYCANTVFPNVGFSDNYPSDGDVIRIQFTLAYGTDIGGGFSGGGGFDESYPIANKDELTALIAQKGAANTPQSVLDTVSKLDATQSEVNAAVKELASTTSGGTPPFVPPVVDTGTKNEVTADLKPRITADKDGLVKVKITKEDVTAALEQAKKDGVAGIVIAPKVTGSASKVSVALPRTAIADIGADPKAKLTVKTGIGDVALPAEALAALAKETGKTVSISAEALKDKDGKATGQVRVELQVDGKTIGPVGGGLAVTLPVEAPTPGTVLMRITPEGAEIIPKSAINGKTLTAHLDGSATLMVKDNSRTFGDVAGSDEGAAAVTFAAARGLLNGVSENSFAPAAPTTRATLVTVLHRLESLPKSDKATAFADVEEGAWYADSVAWAADKGIVLGTGAGFAPEGSLTWGTLDIMLTRYAKTLGLDGAALTDGRALDPNGIPTRGEMAALLQALVPMLLK